MSQYVIGLDYGSDSARAIVVDAATGRQIASSVKYYPRWTEGRYCDASSNRYRQHPLDYIEVLEASVREALAACPEGTARQVAGIAFDTTGSTPAFTDETGMPLYRKKSVFLASHRMSRTSSGVYRARKLQIIVWSRVDLPVPVAPPIRIWFNSDRSP